MDNEELMKKLNEIHEEFRNEFNKFTQMFKILLKQKSDKLFTLEEEIGRKKIMTVNYVEDMFNISRPWALRIMKDLSKSNPNIILIPGNKQYQRGTVIQLVEEADYKNFNKVKEIIDKQGYISLKEVMREFQLCNSAGKMFMENFCYMLPKEYQTDRSLYGTTNMPLVDALRIVRIQSTNQETVTP